MKDREETIAFEMNYCQHYDPQPRGKGCKAGQDIKAIQNVQVGQRKLKWGPCIEGHTLADPTAHCPKWIRRTREMGEARADRVARGMALMEKVMPVVDAWRTRPPTNKAEVIKCPACEGRLHLSQSGYNGHVHGKCETKGCVSWME